jgi:hypothetical protein
MKASADAVSIATEVLNALVTRRSTAAVLPATRAAAPFHEPSDEWRRPEKSAKSWSRRKKPGSYPRRRPPPPTAAAPAALALAPPPPTTQGPTWLSGVSSRPCGAVAVAGAAASAPAGDDDDDEGAGASCLYRFTAHSMTWWNDVSHSSITSSKRGPRSVSLREMPKNPTMLGCRSAAKLAASCTNSCTSSGSNITLTSSFTATGLPLSEPE